MAWIFLPGGLLMPAALPTLERDKIEVDPKWTDNGRFDLQVRGRVKSHLANFARDYMTPGTYSDIQETPEMDYNCRFYTTHDDFAWAMGKAIADIDYLKFKPTAERKEYGEDGKEYHKVLNSIWGSVCALGKPGGLWGKYSSTNPNGYKPGDLSPYISVGTAYTSSKKAKNRAAGTRSYLNAAGTEGYKGGFSWLDDEDYDFDDNQSWTPGRELEGEEIIADLIRDGIRCEDWADYLTEDEWVRVQPFFERELGREVERIKVAQARGRKAARQAKRRRAKSTR